MKTFRELYCERHKLAPERFERAMLRRCLYLQAWLIAWFPFATGSGHFLADLEFVRGVGDLRSRRDLGNEIAEFRYHPRARGFLHRTLRLRVSAGRVRRVFEAHVAAADSRDPVGGSQPPVA